MDECKTNSRGGKNHNFFEKRQIIRYLSAFEKFPFLSARSARVIAILREPSFNMAKLAVIVERSKTFRDHLVKLSGVPEMGHETILEAMRALGEVNTKHLIYSFLIMPLYNRIDQKEWRHVYSTSVLLCNLQRHYHFPTLGLSPLTALLHDIGIPLLRRFMPHRYDDVMDQAHRTQQCLEQAEEAVFNISHAVAGGICVRKWMLPDDVFYAISYHHSYSLPQETIPFQVDIVLLQYVDWLDLRTRNWACRRPDTTILRRHGFQDSDDSYWLEHQRTLLEMPEFMDPDTAADPAENRRNPISEAIAQLVVPLGIVEKQRRKAALKQAQDKTVAMPKDDTPTVIVDLGQVIKEKIRRREEAPAAAPVGATGIPPLPPLAPHYPDPTDPRTMVFSRPKTEKLAWETEADKPLRLRSNGKVLESATRIFKRPATEDKPE
ncbi:MAG: HDOD domain-containing protein [Victivallales bacterium]|nr:HDOD domain-containing protein [Victivallales bacterium]